MAVLYEERTTAIVERLHDGVMLCCPNCRRRAPWEEWRPLKRPGPYRDQLVPVYKCPSCRYVFAPATLRAT